MRDKFKQFDIGGELEIANIPEKGEKPAPGKDAPAQSEQAASQPHSGPDRRKEHRRQGNDRRGEIRFEPGKDDRRSGHDRRKGTWDGKYRV